MNDSGPTFSTDVCRLLGIRYPILQSGMGGVAGPVLVAEVSNAGSTRWSWSQTQATPARSQRTAPT